MSGSSAFFYFTKKLKNMQEQIKYNIQPMGLTNNYLNTIMKKKKLKRMLEEQSNVTKNMQEQINSLYNFIYLSKDKGSIDPELQPPRKPPPKEESISTRNTQLIQKYKTKRTSIISICSLLSVCVITFTGTWFLFKDLKIVLEESGGLGLGMIIIK